LLRDNWTAATGPERAIRTSLAFRIVDPFLMRAPQHFLGHRHRVHLMASKKQGNFLECRIVADIAALGAELQCCIAIGEVSHAAATNFNQKM
jgi:hypothetical protein